jgi:aminocarboxymuconate-semialdehyde decarboxylase
MSTDFHTHVIPPELPDWQAQFGGRWPRMLPQDDGVARLMMGDSFLMHLDDRFCLPARRIEDMKRQGVARQVLSPIPLLTCYGAEAAANLSVSRFLNSYIAQVVADHSGRFIGMATVPLQDPALAIGELRVISDELNMKAVQIGTCPAGRELDDPALFPFFKTCCDLGISVFVHPVEPLVGRDRLNDYYLPNIVGNPLESGLAVARLICGGVLERLSELRICVAHAGGAFPFILGRLDKGFEVRVEMRQRISRRPSEYARMIYVDSLSFDPASLRLAVEKHGRDHVLMGSDYPFLLGDSDPVGSLGRSELDADAVMRIEERNISEFLGQR